MPTSSCILWQGATDQDGYGIRKVRGQLWRAHRYAYVEAYGPIEPGQVVRHRCDTPACINPEHLELGTQADNIRDMDDRGRRVAIAGAEHHTTHLTDDDIRAIRRARRSPRHALARRYGVDEATISDIRARRTWRHVE